MDQLSYTRGSSIPLWLVIRSPDASALDLLSAPKALVVRLRRTVVVNYDSSVLSQLLTIDLTKSEPAAEDAMQSRMYPPTNDDIQTAVWWPVPSTAEGTRILQGEIHLRHGLQPTCHFGNFENFVRTFAVSITIVADADVFNSIMWRCSHRGRTARRTRARKAPSL